MRRLLAVSLVSLVFAELASFAQAPDAAAARPVVPGLQLVNVPDVLYSQLPRLARGQGLVVDQRGNDVPETFAAISRHDVLLSFDGKPLASVDQFNRLVLAAKPQDKARLVVLRAGKELTLNVAIGDAKWLASSAKGTIKPGSPPAVAIECTALDGGKLEIKLQYYSETNSKLETVTCNGSLPEIEKKVQEQRLPNRVQELVDVAFKRLRTANSGN